MNVRGEAVTKKKSQCIRKWKCKRHMTKRTSITENQERDVKNKIATFPNESESERDTMHKRSSSANHRLLETLPSLDPDWGHIVKRRIDLSYFYKLQYRHRLLLNLLKTWLKRIFLPTKCLHVWKSGREDTPCRRLLFARRRILSACIRGVSDAWCMVQSGWFFLVHTICLYQAEVHTTYVHTKSGCIRRNV